MQIHNVIKVHPNHKEKRVGRGGKRGTFSGRGTKGQLARSGRKTRPELRDIIKKIPKLRGYRFKSIQDAAIPINLEDLERVYKAGETVSPKTLVEKGLVRKNRIANPIKILGKGILSKKLSVASCTVSGTAKAAIEKAGGSITA